MISESQQPITAHAAIALAEGILLEQRGVIDAVFQVLELADRALAQGRIFEAQAHILGLLEAAPDFRAKSAVRTLLSDCRGNA